MFNTLRNNRGSLLIISFTILYVISLLTAGFSLLVFGELNAAQRYRDSEVAFWLAEAGVARFVRDPSLLDHGSKTFSTPQGTISLSKSDNSFKRVLSSTGTVRSVRRIIQVDFTAKPPLVFDNAMSSKGDLLIRGTKSAVTINSRLRVGGKVITKSKHPIVLIEDKKESQPDSQVALIYPDANQDGRPDEFADFIEFNRNLLASYPQNDVVYIKGNDTYTLVPNTTLNNKRILFIEGQRGKGDVVIQASGEWPKEQNLTVITTGNVTFNQAGVMPDSSQLNIIAWAGYQESALLPSVHNGVIYTHGVARFDNIYDNSVTNGNVIANAGIEIGEVWSRKTFNYADPRKSGSMPPGFEGLVGSRAAGYETKPGNWREN